MRIPSRAALYSFVFSLILTSALVPSAGNVSLASAGAPAAQLAVQTALNGLHAAGLAGGAQIDLPHPAATPSAASAASVSNPGSALTPDLLNKMLELASLKGTDRENPPLFANALGLSATGQTWPDRQIEAHVNGQTLIHGFAVARGTEQDILVYFHPSDGLHVFRAHRDGTVVAALIFQAGQITMRDPAATQAELDAEFAYWASSIDGLLAGK